MPFKVLLPADITAIKLYWNTIRAYTGDQAYDGLANILTFIQTHRVDPRFLKSLCGSDNRQKRYHSFLLPKRQGGERTIEAPDKGLKWVQRSLLIVLSSVAHPHKCAHGFSENHSIVSHAKIHSGRKWLFVTDIKDFFPSIHWARIKKFCQKIPLEASPDLSRIIANLTTYQGRLPQGAPTSPFLSNILCRRMDHHLYKWAVNNGFRYSRYADDLAFSTNKSQLAEDDWRQIEEIVCSEGFQINEKKRRLVPNRNRQVVTGLVVNGSRPNVRREFVKNLRALLHNVSRYGWESQINRTLAFSDQEHYKEYRSLQLPLDEFRELQKRQNKEHLLISPLVKSHRSRDVLTFQKVVQGKLAYVAQVKGQDSSSFQTLQALADRAFGHNQLLIVDDLYSQQFYESHRVYHHFKEEVKRATTVEELRNLINRSKERNVLEFTWILSPEAKPDLQDIVHLKRSILEAKYLSLCSSVYTANFFRYFIIDGYFTSMLQSPGNSAPSFASLLEASKLVFRQYKTWIPNHLRQRIKWFLIQCEQFSIKNPGTHPWTIEDALDRIILPFKKSIRFDEDRTNATDLIDTFEQIKNELLMVNPIYRNRIKMNIKQLRSIFTDVASVKDGLSKILRSMIASSNGEITISSEATDRSVGGFETYSLLLSDPGRILIGSPLLESIFDRGLRSALSGLRGYVDWKIASRFSDGSAVEFDVMRNKVLDRSQKWAGGFEHRITLHRYIP